MLSPQDLFDLSNYTYVEIFEGCNFAWEALSRIEDYIKEQYPTVPNSAVKGNISDGVVVIKGDVDIGNNTIVETGAFIRGRVIIGENCGIQCGADIRGKIKEREGEPLIEKAVYIGKGTHIESGAFIQGPAIIGENCEIRQGAYIRGNVILGNKCVVGHATEVKNSIFLDEAQAPHFAYVGDSILGNRVNLGAGTRLANLPLFSTKDPVTSKRSSIRLQFDDQEIDTGLAKLGAILGDDVQTGCNVVTSPGCIVGRRTFIYALLSLRKGYHPANSLIKLLTQTERVPRR